MAEMDGVANDLDDPGRLSPEGPQRTCPRCSTSHPQAMIQANGFRCPDCGLELAHVETTSAGLVRGVLSWLRSPGDVLIDRYRILQVLGKGGFAATYLVEDQRLDNRKRAVKEIPKEIYDNSETAFLAQLSHPGIPDIVDRAETESMVYLVLEFGGGRTLESERQRLGGRIPLQILVPWLGQLRDVLTYLHGQTPPIVHRDLKPDNVLLDEQNRVMLIDFGIAKQTVNGATTRLLAQAVSHGYSPPEQTLGTGTDPRSDVYSLAATIYALLSGQVPPPAHERVAGAELVTLSAILTDLPDALSSALERGLTLNINQRPRSVSELLAPFVGDAASMTTAGTAGLTVRLHEETGPKVATDSARIHLAKTQRLQDRGLFKHSYRILFSIVVSLAAGLIITWLFFQDPNVSKGGSVTTDGSQERGSGQYTDRDSPGFVEPELNDEVNSETLDEQSKADLDSNPSVDYPSQEPPIDRRIQWYKPWRPLGNKDYVQDVPRADPLGRGHNTNR